MEAISFESILPVAFGGDPADRLERLRELIPEMMDRCDSPFTLIPYFRRDSAGHPLRAADEGGRGGGRGPLREIAARRADR